MICHIVDALRSTQSKVLNNKLISNTCKHLYQTLPIGTKKGWELIGVEHGLRLWQRSEAEDDLKFGSSVILPVSLKVRYNLFWNKFA